MTIAVVVIAWIVVAFLGWSFIRGGTRKPVPHYPLPEYENRYKGGHQPCRICGEPSEYSDNMGAVHVHCRNGSRVLTP
jgi:hypothetical protein